MAIFLKPKISNEFSFWNSLFLMIFFLLNIGFSFFFTQGIILTEVFPLA